ncbi:phosphate/phosphite/phosphonate ABC transporter substrate-binding protein [Pseudomonas saudiphocaensis]|uniref:Phosphonate ABC transporter periplasmic phosphonate-binding protein n=1 Tax=Pseudomonas saudiphocaensis TaxID=1499686 RepID=A0A078LZ42_9PSED|nr:phosphate/phosphite/phosphonate ABC transporter substrate-binding protein [Pseudomonas saudiphocaensis]RRV16280.1 phosphate/phosphite/phosphonate ABC transporter substrate-binding protein [Pseudomonas saudiphocaensis]CDZ95582.1 phosphonate ABC transporter periplasmic phosphonate-binding protein [Pseudomonas saudiphocaensis]
MRFISAAAGLICTLLLPLAAMAECTQPSLRLAVIPKKSMQVTMREYRPLLNLLSDELKMPVDMVAVSSYESVIDAIVSGGVDIAWLGPASYIQAYLREPGIEPFASLTLSEGHFTPAGHHYRALLMVRRDGASDLDELRGASVALSDPASTSGSLVPKTEFSAQTNLPLERFFSAVSYSGSHDNSLDALLEGRVDAAFVASVRADAYLSDGRMERDTLRLLWQSAPIYYDPYVFSARICPELKERVRQVMLSHPQSLADFLNMQHASGVAPVGHAEYLPLLKLINK